MSTVPRGRQTDTPNANCPAATAASSRSCSNTHPGRLRHRFPAALAALVDEALHTPGQATVVSARELEIAWECGYDCGRHDSLVDGEPSREWMLVAYLICLASGGLVAGAAVWGVMTGIGY